MNKCLIVAGTVGLLMLSACSSSPTTVSAASPAETVAATDLPPVRPAQEETGLGLIVYNGQTLASCAKVVRTGTRIRRDVCRPDSFNGLFPSGGMNMGTGGEGQIGYGSKRQ